MNDKSDLVKEIKDAIWTQLLPSAHVSPVISRAMWKSFDLFDALLVVLNGLCCKYSLSYDEHKIIVHVFPAVSYPERTFTINVNEGTVKCSFL